MRFWAAVLTLLVLAVIASWKLSGAAADTPPDQVYGSVTVNRQNAPSGASVAASIATTVCGSAKYDGVRYAIALAAFEPCSTAGSMLTFTVNGQPAHETAMVGAVVGNVTHRDLTVGEAALSISTSGLL